MSELLKDIGGKPAAALLDKLGIKEVPVDPFLIAKELGVEISERLDFKNIKNSGSITKTHKKVSVWLNPLDPPNRKKFTLAHEIGHYINDILTNGELEFTDTPETLYRSGEAAPQEYAANKFAGELLMPEREVLQIGKEILENDDDHDIPLREFVELMAQRFAVSKAAMLVRLKVLELVDQNVEL